MYVANIAGSSRGITRTLKPSALLKANDAGHSSFRVEVGNSVHRLRKMASSGAERSNTTLPPSSSACVPPSSVALLGTSSTLRTSARVRLSGAGSGQVNGVSASRDDQG